MQYTKTTLTNHPLRVIEIFSEQFGDELDACHPAAFDEVYQLLSKENQTEVDVKIFLSDFYFEYGDELEGCNEEAYSFLTSLIDKYHIEV